MNKYKNKQDDALTADWLRDNGIATNSFNTTHVKLLQAQQTAHTLLTQNHNLLTSNQIKALKQFQHKMANKRARVKLKPEAAYTVLNISTKINRQLFSLNKQL